MPQPASEANAERAKLISRRLRPIRSLERQLKSLDPQLSLVYVDEGVARVPESERPPGLYPARWHVRREGSGWDSYWPIMGPEGEYVEPTSKLVDDMKKADLWRAGALQELRERQEREAKAQAHKEALEREQARDEASLIWRAAKRVPGEGGMLRRLWAKK